MPRLMIRYGGCPAISWSSKRIDPALGTSVPESMLKIVLLPEPLGPIRPTISPFSTPNDTRLTAVKPPKRLVRPWTASKKLGREAHCAAYGDVPGSGRTGSRCCWLLGQTRYGLSSMYWRMTGKARSFWPDLALELHAEAEHRAALGQVDLECRLPERVGVDAAVLLDGARQHFRHEHVRVAGRHPDVRRADLGARLRLLVLLADHLDHRRQRGAQRLLVGQPDRDRVDVEEVEIGRASCRERV